MTFGEVLSIILSIIGLGMTIISFKSDNYILLFTGIIIMIICFFVGRYSHKKKFLKHKGKENIRGRKEIIVYYPSEFKSRPNLTIIDYGWEFYFDKVEENPSYFKLKIDKKVSTGRSGDSGFKWIAVGERKE